MTEKIYTDYFIKDEAFTKNHFYYPKLHIPHGIKAQPLAVPQILAPDKETDTDVWFTLKSITGESQILPGVKTKTWAIMFLF